MTISEGSRSTEQNEQLAAINNAIAEETRQTVLESFNQELNAQLANAKTITDMLNVIEQRRKELANDGTELDTEKGKTLDDAEKRIKDQAKADYESMLNEYGTFEQRKAILAEEFAKNVRWPNPTATPKCWPNWKRLTTNRCQNSHWMK